MASKELPDRQNESLERAQPGVGTEEQIGMLNVPNLVAGWDLEFAYRLSDAELYSLGGIKENVPGFQEYPAIGWNVCMLSQNGLSSCVIQLQGPGGCPRGTGAARGGESAGRARTGADQHQPPVISLAAMGDLTNFPHDSSPTPNKIGSEKVRQIIS
jgi:hypothetical protein